MFYDSERIRRKNIKYDKLKAYEMAIGLLAKNNIKECLHTINLLIEDTPNEYKKSMLILTKKTLQQMESANECATKNDTSNI